MRRRKFLLGSVFSAGAFAEPALIALTVPPTQSTARTAGQRVGLADVTVLTEQITNLSKLADQYGSGRVREQMVALLHHEANRLLHGSYSEKTGRALLSAADISSTIILKRLRTLQRQVHPLRSSSPHLLDLDERLTVHLTRRTRQD